MPSRIDVEQSWCGPLGARLIVEWADGRAPADRLEATIASLEGSGWDEVGVLPGCWIGSIDDGRGSWTATVSTFGVARAKGFWDENDDVVLSVSLTQGSEEREVDAFLESADLLGEPEFVDGQLLVPALNELRAYDPSTGQLVWASEPCLRPDLNPFVDEVAGGVPVVCDGRELVVIDLASGETRWRWPIPGSIDNVRTTPTAVLVIVDDRSVYALDGVTGAAMWTQPEGPRNAYVVGDDELVFIGGDKFLGAFDIATGQGVWGQHYPSTWLWSADEGLLARRSGSVMVLDKRTGLTTLATVESVPADNTAIAGALPGIVIANALDKGVLTASDLTTGAILWTYASPHGELIYTDVDDDHIAVFYTPGHVDVLSTRSGEVVMTLDDVAASPPAVGGGVLAWTSWGRFGNELHLDPIP